MEVCIWSTKSVDIWCLRWCFVDGRDVSAKCYLPTGPPDCFIDPTNDEHLDVREPRIVSGDVTRNGYLCQGGFHRCPLPDLMRVASVSPIPQAHHIFGELYNDNGYISSRSSKAHSPYHRSSYPTECVCVCVPSDTSVHNHVHKVMSCHVFFRSSDQTIPVICAGHLRPKLISGADRFRIPTASFGSLR